MKHGLLFSCVLACTTITQPVFASRLQQATAPYVISDYAKTKYPLVLVPGLVGFNRFGSDGLGLDYWYQILPDLAKNGAVAFATRVSPVNSTEVRGEQLLQQVDEIIALTGKPKVNLLGHSHGGPTIQYIEGVAPEKIASLTPIAGSMKGTPIADSILASNVLNPLATVVFSLIGTAEAILQADPDLPVDYAASMKSISTAGSQSFNAKYGSAAIPADCNSSGQKVTPNGIYHYSFMGNRQVTNLLDVLDSAVAITGVALLQGKTDNDGLISLCSGSYGQVIRNDYRWNHFDEVNQVLGLRELFSQDPVAVYRQHANRLKLQGL